MKQRHVMAATVLGAIFVVLAIFLVIALIKGDDTADPPYGSGSLVVVHGTPAHDS